MSQLYFSETGRVVPTLGEELTTFRRARKILELPDMGEMASVYLLARAHPGSESPLHLTLNGVEVGALSPEGSSCRWYETRVDPGLIRAGSNEFEMWSESTAMDSWSLALEPGHANPASYVTDDGGGTWRNHRMAYLNAVRGEYVLRVRTAEGQDPSPPALVWEDPENPRLDALRGRIPESVLHESGTLNHVRSLSAWIAASWEHTNAGVAAQYAPWDAETALAWGGAKTGHAGYRPVVMCVHYAVTLASCCQALGIPARCAALLGTPNGCDGHFVAEVWSEDYGKWVMVDPNSDATCWKDGKPLSITEIRAEGEGISECFEWGEGSKFQRQFPHMVEFSQENLERGICFRHRGLWPRVDFLSRPDRSPPGHGSLSYCETDLVWESGDREAGFGMFPHFADREYFEKPPDTQTGQ
jgi:hypothetical protein